jgi:hypothetical protein
MITLDARLEDARRRQGVIGQRARWVVRFANLPLQDLRHGQTVDTIDDVLAFIRAEDFGLSTVSLGLEDLQQLQDDLKTLLGYMLMLDFEISGVPNPQTPTILMDVLATARHIADAGQRLLTEGLSVRTLFGLWVSYELGAARTKIRRCQRCGTIFHRTRRQLFCSPRCLQFVKAVRRGRTPRPEPPPVIEPYVLSAIKRGTVWRPNAPHPAPRQSAKKPSSKSPRRS